MMVFCKFSVTAVAMAILFLYCFSNCDFVGNTFSCFSNRLAGSLHTKPLHGLELITFSTIPSNKFCHGNTLSFSWTYI